MLFEHDPAKYRVVHLYFVILESHIQLQIQTAWDFDGVSDLEVVD